MTIEKNCFASDNYAGIAPQAFEALTRANQGFDRAYGEDAWTKEASDLIRNIFETDCEVFFAFNGTASNGLALASMCQSYHSVISHRLAHIETDECGGPEFFSNGTKLLTVEGADGKVSPDQLHAIITKRSDIHFPKPRVLSLTQATEVGTVYQADEIAALKEITQTHQMKIHMDGARFANAVASLNVSPKEITWQAGVDVLCFGGTKMGLPVGEAIVFFNSKHAEDFAYRCKQAGQLASKMRYIAAPWVGMLKDDVWLDHARHANQCAQQLAAGLSRIDGIEMMSPVEANGVFAQLPTTLAQYLRDQGWRFYDFIGEGGARFMCSWQTRSSDIEALLNDANKAPS